MDRFEFDRPVFLLGAGFSHHATACFQDVAAAPLPLTKELSGRISAQDIVPSIVLRLGDDFEEWLTYLATRAPWTKAPDDLTNRAVFMRLTRSIGDHIRSTTDAYRQSRQIPGWLSDLVGTWGDKRAHVITLNYDTLIESLIVRLVPRNQRDVGILYPAPIARAAQRLGGTFAPPSVQTAHLYKLHGSTNWYRSEAFPGQPLYYVSATWPEDSDLEQREERVVSDLEPFIVPPSLDKSSYLMHDTLRLTWRLAADAIRGSDALIAVGYSLPATDLAMKSFLKANAPDQKVPLVVVDPSEDTAERYRSALGDLYDIDVSLVGPDSIERLAGICVKHT